MKIKCFLILGGSANYKFVGTKTFENPRLNYRYPLGTYEFTEPDEDTRFNYMMLSRLQSDCEYVVGHFSNFCKRKIPESSIANVLWGTTIDRHIVFMIIFLRKKAPNGSQEYKLMNTKIKLKS